MSNETKVPFFARYLEGQYPVVKTDLRGGKRGWVAVTLKYPSDNDDNPPMVTLKYPSDNDG